MRFGVGYDLDEYALVGLQLGEAEVNADRAKEFVPAPRRVSHAVQAAVELIDVLLFVFIAFGWLAVDGGLIGVDDALDECYLHVVLKYHEHGECR